MNQIKSIKPKELHFDKYISLLISFIGIYTGLTHNYENQILILFIIYYLNDLTKNITTDFIIHHTLGLMITFIGLYIKFNHLPREQSRQMLLNMEITTPIYILSNYFDELKPIFFISFFYYRIYMQYILLNDIKTYNEFITTPITSSLYMIYSGFFALNMYWFMIMIKILSKRFKDPKYIFCHKLIPFIRPLNFNLLNFYSTLSNYLYHEDIYTANTNMENMKNYVSPQTMVHSIVNSIVSISTIEPCYYKYSIALHACKIFNLYVKHKSNFDIITIGVDTCFYFSSDALIIYYIFILVHKMKPFYNLNPMVIHILLLVLRSYKRV
jgi:hypothetical protein